MAKSPADDPLASALAAGATVLLAVDRTSASDSAARVALDLAERRGARVHVLTVVDTHSTPMPASLGRAIAVADEAYGATVHEEQKRELRIALSTTLDRQIDWPVEVKLGTPSRVIVEEARRIGASLVVLGLRRHHAVERALHDETALNVMRAAPCPVLGVTPGTTSLPRRIVVGVDFSAASLAAARAARAHRVDGGTLVLVYSAPPADRFLPDDGERVIHELGVSAAFDSFSRELAAPGVTIERASLPHRPGQSVCQLLMDHADEAPADMIALGSVRQGRVERWILGSVTTDVARDGSYSLLVVPPAESARTR
jgi:nucleotide-binding universal stress UspA family protein